MFINKIITWSYCVLFIVVPLIWLPQTSELFEFNKIIVTYILTVIILTAWAIRCILEKRLIFRRTILDIPLLVFLITSSLSLFFSIDIHTSIFGYYSRWNGGLLSLLTYASLYWAFVSNITAKKVLVIVNCGLVIATVIAVYGIFEHFGVSPSCILTTGRWDVACWVQDVQTRVFATLGQPNWLAAYLTAVMFIPLSQLLNFKFLIFNFKTILNFLIFNLLFVALLFTKSRSGLLAFGLSFLVFLIILIISNIKNSLQISNFKFQIVAFLTLTVTLTLTFPNPVRDLVFRQRPAPSVQLQGTSLETGGTESGQIRKIVWKGALLVWTGSFKNFLIGTGPETFAQAYYQYRPIEHNQTSEWELLYNKAHNEYLNQLVTTGVLGGGGYIVLLIVMGWVFIKPQIPNPKPQGNSNIQNPSSNSVWDLNSWNLKYSLGFEAWSLRFALFAGFISIIVTNFWGFSVVITQILLFLLPAMAIALQNED